MNFNPGVTIKLSSFYMAVLLPVLLSAQEEKLNEKIFAEYNNVSLKTVIEDFRERTGFNFIYNDDLVGSYKISDKFVNKPVKEILSEILNKAGISYKVYDDESVVLFKKRKIKEKSFITSITSSIDSSEREIPPAFIKPELLSIVKPVYPEGAVRANIEGIVRIKILVTKEGIVSKASIERSSGYNMLDSAAVNYAHTLQYNPALINGIPQNIWVAMVFRYRITGSE